VEDDDVIRGLVRAILERGGLRVVEAIDGEEALELAERASPDLVLLDVNLPGIDGPEVCRRLRAAGATLPIVMVTGAADEDDRRRGLEAGADAYLTKPFRPADLLARLAGHLGGA
jgi:DNA-binding response OmpR family regulator